MFLLLYRRFRANTPELLWYKFDGTGTSVPNLASTPPPGTATATLMGGLTQGGSDICDGTVIGTGISSTTDYVNTGWATNLSGTSWTISFRTKDITPSSTLFYVFGDAGAGTFRCFTNGVAGPNNWWLRGGFTDVSLNGGAIVGPTMNTFVYDMGLGNIKAYLNGVLVNTVAQTGPTIAGAGPLKVVGYSGNVGAPAGGKLDDFRVYNRALNAQEILDIYNGVNNNFLPADQLLCANDSIAVGSSINGTYSWNTGASTDSIWVDSAGQYIATLASTCANGTDTVNIIAAPALPMAGFAGPDDTICVGDTLPLGYSTTDSILWSTGATTDSIWVSSPGQYEVAITGYCGTVRDTVRIDSSALIYAGFAVADTNGGCVGDTISLMTTSPFSSYVWSTGDSTQTIWVTGGGSYIVNVMDGCGSGVDTVEVDPFIVGPSAAFTSSVNMMDASFTDNSTGSNLAYAWNFGDGNTSTTAAPTHTYAANGTYIVTLTVSNACGSSMSTDTVVINFIGIANPSNMDVNVYPNPAHDRVMVATALTEIQDLRVSIVSLMGQVMVEQQFTAVNGSFRQALDLNTLAAGVYFLQVEGTAGKHVTRLVVE
ncbi:MAG: T9SS type A sorting domain-containing protein [Bacteroidetes bacterium]|nr:T9SS type A sorting domain-containing protein [Bacteroidota bacterium]